MGTGTVYEELDEAKVNIENLKANYKIKLELSESLKRSYNEQFIKNQEANLKIEKLSQEVIEKSGLLEEVKIENEKLKENYQLKVELSDRLRRVLNEQLNKNQDAVLKIEKLSQELREKIEETSLVKEKCEEIEIKLKEKDSILNHLTCLNDKLRAENKDKITNFEDENLRLGLALDESNTKNIQQEQLIKSFQEEIDRFKGLVSVSKSSTSNKSIQETMQKDIILQKTEEEKNKYENQLKWKKEQFNHLQEAHEKLRSDFNVKEKEWDQEKASLFDELSILQTKLDSQTRLSESLKSRLEMCNNALSHAESKRKRLEVELSESRSNFDSVYAEYEESKSTIEQLTSQRDQEIARLRCSLAEKDNHYKEIEYQVKILEQENKDLISSLKELQENHIQGGDDSSSLMKIRNKLERIEQVHKDCSEKLKTKESDWSIQMESLLEKLKSCNMELNTKSELIDKLKSEIETCDFKLLEQGGLHNEEVSITSLALKSELSVAEQKFAAELAQNEEEHKERFSLLIKLLDGKSFDLVEARKLVEVERMKLTELDEKIASMEGWELSLVKEIEMLKQELSESNARNLTTENLLNEVRINTLTKEKVDLKICEATIVLDIELLVWKSIALQFKTKLEEDHLNRIELNNHVKKLQYAVDRANEELAEKLCERNEVEFQLQTWKSIAQQLNTKLDECHCLRSELEGSLLAEVSNEVNLKQEKHHLLTLLEEKDKKIENLDQELVSWQKTSPELSNALFHAEEWMKSELEGAILMQIMKSLEQDIKNSKFEECHCLHSELESSLLAEVGNEVNLLTSLEEKDNKIKTLNQELVSSRKTSLGLSNTLLLHEEEWMKSELEGAILMQIVKSSEQDIKNSTVKINSFHDEVVAMVIIKEIEIEERNLIIIEIEDLLKLSLHKLNELCDEDMKLTDKLECIMQVIDEEDDMELETYDPKKENKNMTISTLKSSLKSYNNLDQRCPFRAIND